jgi:hypothetical protein
VITPTISVARRSGPCRSCLASAPLRLASQAQSGHPSPNRRGLPPLHSSVEWRISIWYFLTMRWTLLELPNESGLLLPIDGQLLPDGSPCSYYLCGQLGHSLCAIAPLTVSRARGSPAYGEGARRAAQAIDLSVHRDGLCCPRRWFPCLLSILDCVGATVDLSVSFLARELSTSAFTLDGAEGVALGSADRTCSPP